MAICWIGSENENCDFNLFHWPNGGAVESRNLGWVELELRYQTFTKLLPSEVI